MHPIFCRYCRISDGSWQAASYLTERTTLHRMMKVLSLIKSEINNPDQLTKLEGLTHSTTKNSKIPNLTTMTSTTPEVPPSTTSSTFPPLDVNMLGVPQPSLVTKDILIIIFMLLFWGYSLYLTYKAWYKLLYSDTGEERSNMWR